MSLNNRTNLVPDGNGDISFTRSVYDTNNPAPTLTDWFVIELNSDRSFGINDDIGKPSWVTVSTSTRSETDGLDTLNYLDIDFTIDTANARKNYTYLIEFTVQDNVSATKSYQFRFDNGFFDPTSPLNSDIIISRRYHGASGGSVVTSIPNFGDLGGQFNIINGEATLVDEIQSVDFNNSVQSKGLGYYELSPTGGNTQSDIRLEFSSSDVLPTSDNPPSPLSMFFLVEISSGNGTLFGQGAANDSGDSRLVFVGGGNGGNDVYQCFGLQNQCEDTDNFVNNRIWDAHWNYGGDTNGNGDPIADNAVFRQGFVRFEQRNNTSRVGYWPSGTFYIAPSSLEITRIYEIYLFRSALTEAQIQKIYKSMNQVYGDTTGRDGFSNNWSVVTA